MSKPTIVFVIVGLIIATMSAGCLGNVSNEMETGNIELENDIIQLNNTITNLTLDNDAKDGDNVAEDSNNDKKLTKHSI